MHSQKRAHNTKKMISTGNHNTGFQDVFFWIKFKPSKHFNAVSTLFIGWYGVTTTGNVKPTLKKHCLRQHWNLQRWITSNQRCLSRRWSGQRWTMLPFSKSISATLGNVKKTLWIWSFVKNWKNKLRAENVIMFLSFK